MKCIELYATNLIPSVIADKDTGKCKKISIKSLAYCLILACSTGNYSFSPGCNTESTLLEKSICVKDVRCWDISRVSLIKINDYKNVNILMKNDVNISNKESFIDFMGLIITDPPTENMFYFLNNNNNNKNTYTHLTLTRF